MTRRYTRYPGESAVPGLGLPGNIIPGLEYLQAVNPRIPIRVYDINMVRTGEIALYTSLNITENFYTPHTWELKVNRFLPNVISLVPNGYISVVQDTVSGTAPFVGAIESLAPVMEASGKDSEIWTLSGRSPKGYKLKKRRCMNKFSTGDGYDTQTNVAYETAMRHTITENVISAKGLDGNADTGRNIAGITLETIDQQRGGTATELKTRADKLLDLLESWGRKSLLGTDLVWTGTGNNFQFQASSGTDRTGAGAAKKVVLSVDFRNVLGYKYTYSVLDEVTVLYAGGDGDGASRAVVEVYTGTRPTGESRSEEFFEASDCTTTDQLTTKGQEQLATLGPQQSLEFQYDPTTASYVYGRDFFLGDKIEVTFPDVATMDAQLVSVSRTYDENGLDVKMTVGTESPDMAKIVKTINALTYALRRH